MSIWNEYKLNKELEPLDYIRGYKDTRSKKATLEKYICLDTETSHNHNEDNPICWVYQWAFTFNKGLYFGRSPQDLIDKLEEITLYYESFDKATIKIYVHNLPYDFSYLAGFFFERWGNPVSMLAYANHKPFSVTYSNGLNFLCSYKLSNDSLKRWGDKLNVRHKKLVGAIDYDKERYLSSQLYRNDWLYQFYDVITLDECIEKQMEIYGDNIASIPLTSTGYVRRELRKEFKKNIKNRHKFIETRMNEKEYSLCKLEFSGGITHGNRFYAGKLVDINSKEFKQAHPQATCIRHRDFRSHYPSQQRTQRFAMGKIVKLKNECSIEEIEAYTYNNAILLDIEIKNLCLRSSDITLPYAQHCHFYDGRQGNVHFVCDNGRILFYEGVCRVVLFYEEFQLLKKQYSFEYKINCSYCSALDYLPSWLTETIDRNFKGKSDYKIELKHLEEIGASEVDIINADTNLMKSKNVVNGIYGVSATNPIREEVTLNGDTWETKKDIEHTQEALDKFYNSHNNFMRYIWGCQTTLYARMELMYFVELIGYDNFLYADTDSIFYISTLDIEKKIEDTNKELSKCSMELGAYITDSKGKVIEYNQFTDEGETIETFKFLHAKCYGYTLDSGKMLCTIAGVPKRCGNVSRETELGTLDNLKNGFTFVKCGGTKIKYLTLQKTTYKGCVTYGGGIITNTTKTLNEDFDITKKENLFITFADNVHSLVD